MNKRLNDWIKRYGWPEIAGTLLALIFAWSAYSISRSYIAGSAAGWVGEGIGFYGLVISRELLFNHRKYREKTFWRRLGAILSSSGSNLAVEFLPAEIVDNFALRPLAFFFGPQFIHPFPVGFLVAKFSTDLFFYAVVILGFELNKKYRHR